MNAEQWKGKWKELKGRIKETWGEFTDDEIAKMEGRRERLAGLIEQKYGVAKEAVEEQISEFEREFMKKPR